MSTATRLKRLSKLEQKLKERYEPQWNKLGGAVFSLYEAHPEMQALLAGPRLNAAAGGWYEAHPEIQALEAEINRDPQETALRKWWLLLEGLLERYESNPPLPVPPCPEIDPTLALRRVAVLERDAGGSPDPHAVLELAHSGQLHLDLLEGIRAAFPEWNSTPTNPRTGKDKALKRSSEPPYGVRRL